MSFDGSGTFNINTAGQPVVDGTTIDATVFNNLTADLAAGLSTCLTKDGQTTPTANIPMGANKITGLATGTDNTDAAAVQNVNARSMCEGRLTLESGVPISTSDQADKETLYYTPYTGNCIALYDGTNWVRRTFTELSIDVPDATNVYDVFAYDNSGTVALELTAWATTETRATALTTQNGVYVKTGALTRRYLGSFYSTTDGNGQIDDTNATRHLWNYYNRVVRPVQVALAGAAGYTYTTATWRQANANTGNQISIVVGVNEDMFEVGCYGDVANTNANVQVWAAPLFNSTTVYSDAFVASIGGNGLTTLVAGVAQPFGAVWRSYPTAGYHYWAWGEKSAATGTTTWNALSGAKMSGFFIG